MIIKNTGFTSLSLIKFLFTNEYAFLTLFFVGKINVIFFESFSHIFDAFIFYLYNLSIGIKLKMKKKILLIHKKNCLYSKNLIQFLKKKFYLKTTCVANIKSLNKITKDLKFDFIILFRSHLILTKQFIVKNKNIINFHPSTPNYRGVGGINFAIYNKEKYFGSTAHFVNAKIDFGKIIHVKRFKLKLRSDLNNAYIQTLKGMLKQAKYIFNNIEKINLLIKKAKNEKWSYSVIKRKI